MAQQLQIEAPRIGSNFKIVTLRAIKFHGVYSLMTRGSKLVVTS
jgi:hypothetical protein